jgi:hypothetical protein
MVNQENTKKIIYIIYYGKLLLDGEVIWSSRHVNGFNFLANLKINDFMALSEFRYMNQF